MNKACKSQNTLLEDGNLCALGSEFVEKLGIEEGTSSRSVGPTNRRNPLFTSTTRSGSRTFDSGSVRRAGDGSMVKDPFEGEVLPLE